MNDVINSVCIELQDFSRVLKEDASKSIKNILPKSTPQIPSTPVRQGSQVSNPERPWQVSGVAAIAVGVIGAFTSSGVWPYVVGAAGVASVIYGQTKKNSGRKETSVPYANAEMSEPKAYEVSEKVIEISKMVENKWREKVESCKSKVQSAITASSASADIKDTLMSDTYTTERISIDYDDVMRQLESKPSSSYPAILAEYERNVTNCISKAVSQQVAIYSNISQKL